MTHLDHLAERPEGYHVFMALRILEAAHADAPRLGEGRRPREDRVRLGQAPEMAFPPTTIRAFERARDGRPGRLSNRFFGLFGPQGPLPLHLTEFARDRQRNHRDGTFVAFADMLTHRLLGLLYRAWASAQPTVSHDRGVDPFAGWVSAVAGYHGKGLSRRDAMPDDARRHFAAHMGAGPRTVEGLVAILSSFLDVPVTIEEFVGSWLALEEADRWRLGARVGLGHDTALGSRVWSRGGKFRVRLGPLDRASYDRLLPGGESMERVQAILRNYVGDALDWEIVLVLAGTDVPRAAIDGTTRLGQTGWLRGPDIPSRDAADLAVQRPRGPDAGRAA